MKKLGKNDKLKIQARWVKKYEEFIKLDKEELKRLYTETKMSSTDRHALVEATRKILYDEREKEIGIQTSDEQTDGEISEESNGITSTNIKEEDSKEEQTKGN